MRTMESCAGAVACGGCEACLAFRSRPELAGRPGDTKGSAIERLLGPAKTVFADLTAEERAVFEAAAEAELDYELSAAFGPGVEVVNVLTGEKRRTR